MELTIENLKNCTYQRIAIFDNEKLIDVVYKDVRGHYWASGTDEFFDEKELIDMLTPSEAQFMYNADTIKKPE